MGGRVDRGDGWDQGGGEDGGGMPDFGAGSWEEGKIYICETNPPGDGTDWIRSIIPRFLRSGMSSL